MKKQAKASIIMAAGMIIAAALSRLLPHPYNFTPVAAMALFGGASLKDKRLAFLFPLGALLLSDVCFQLFTSTPGFYSWSQFINYGAFMIITLIGIYLPKINFKNVAVASLAASTLFFILSNFGVWLVSSGITYTHSFAGLIACYAAGIPFFGGTALGDLFYCGVLFGGFYLVNKFIFKTSRLTA